MDVDVPILFGSLLFEVLWRRALRSRGWSKERIRRLEWRIAFFVITAMILGFIGLVASQS